MRATSQTWAFADPEEVTGNTGPDRWFAATFFFTNSDPGLSPATITIGARALSAGRSFGTTASLRVQPFPYRSSLSLREIVHVENGAWVPTTVVHLGEEFRVTGTGSLNEPAGTFVTFVGGIVSIRSADTTFASAALQSGDLGSGNENAAFRLTDPADVGQVEAVLDGQPTANALSFTLVAVQQ